ncbi:hypothetical protein B0T26DRAFT_697603 [Lasiosphaeria miniovina]|uniref:Secreted protein n=1 Tax=Lasiosphaeria miniovina TaxID=1954250 RepID=A0AA40E4X3_9PEZI|nr:uncharacterized protein B0T26DRAFT_697603 [Lasiosphaeria miniovina]KAK0728329.1 hypothetical protein B0T26DRAFT_697603 [Lasiosphaeria miniovina]
MYNIFLPLLSFLLPVCHLITRCRKLKPWAGYASFIQANDSCQAETPAPIKARCRGRATRWGTVLPTKWTR